MKPYACTTSLRGMYAVRETPGPSKICGHQKNRGGWRRCWNKRERARAAAAMRWDDRHH